jgi:hypothetical protein
MRVAAITHDPAPFLAFHRDCATLSGRGGRPNLRWYLAQTVLAMAGEADLAERLGTHVEKALREAKRATFWSAPNPDVEDAARAFAARLAGLPASELAPLLARATRLEPRADRAQADGPRHPRHLPGLRDRLLRADRSRQPPRGGLRHARRRDWRIPPGWRATRTATSSR